MKDVYASVPVLESSRWQLRQTTMEDAADLLEVYSDRKAVPFFNSDNCHGETFYYETIEKMREAIAFWESSYQRKEFVRWSIVEKSRNKAIGTIELFHRDAEDFFTDTGLLRLDLKSEYETSEAISEILELILPETCELFRCGKIASKASPPAKERIRAFLRCGFQKSEQCLVGHDGTKYGFYYVLEK